MHPASIIFTTCRPRWRSRNHLFRRMVNRFSISWQARPMFFRALSGEIVRVGQKRAPTESFNQLLQAGFASVFRFLYGIWRQRLTLVRPAGSWRPLAARSQANFRRISCTRFNKLLVRLIRGKSRRRPLQMGRDFLRCVLVLAVIRRGAWL
jgi:hypothetical protein